MTWRERVRHSDLSYIIIGSLTLLGCFTVVIVQLTSGHPMPSEPWYVILGIMGHFFGRSNGNGKSSNGP